MRKAPHIKRPRDPNELARLMVEIATGAVEDTLYTEDGRDAAAVLMGRKGGLKGGRARASVLSAEKRSEIAKKAATARWEKRRG